MIYIPGYDIKEELNIGSDSIIYRAVEEKENRPVIIKLLKSEYPNPEELKIFQTEFKISRSLESVEGVAKNFRMIDYKNTKAIIIEDFGGISLDKIIEQKKINIKTFLNHLHLNSVFPLSSPSI